MLKASSGDLGLFHDALPPEIWLKVFPELPFESLPAVTLTCRLFRWMAQPLMFSVFDISPFFLNNGSERPALRPKEYLDRTIQRLDFFCSKRIAPAVKHCWISPYSPTHRFEPYNGEFRVAPGLIIDVTVKALPQFPNLRKLSWHCSDMIPQWWTVIERLPLKSMWLNSSCTVETTGPSQLTIEFLDLDRWAWQGGTTDHDSMYELRSPGVSQSLMSLVIHPDHIQRISVARNDTGRRLLSTIAAMDMLRCLRILSIPVAATTSISFIPALIQCPNLEELRLLSTVFDPVQDHPITLQPSTLPSLAVYEGPYTHILTFASGRPLRSVILWGYDDYPLCDPDLLLDALYRLSMLDIRLESLNLSVTHLTNNILANLVLFPWLISVAIESVDASLLFSSLTVCLSVTNLTSTDCSEGIIRCST
jgi:hypothetical protein